MKNLLVLSVVCLFGVSPSLTSAQDASEIISWNVEHIDLGTIQKGQKIENLYSFTNTSTVEVEIDLVSTCECTEATWTQGKIAPGDTGSVKFVFDSNKKDEEESVDVDVYFLNTNPKTERPYTSYLTYTYKFSK